MDSETCDSFISVIPAKAGIQNRSMPPKDLDTKTPLDSGESRNHVQFDDTPQGGLALGESIRRRSLEVSRLYLV